MASHRIPANKLPIPVGEQFGFLTVLREAQGQKWTTMVECQCVCGAVVVKRLASLRSHVKAGVKPSCGCRGDPTHGEIQKHGHRSRPYRIWVGMKNRCNNPKNKDFKNYGARGIKVSDDWETFNGFWKDMKSGYSEDRSIDRIDPNKGYCKENCRWATTEEQAYNKRLTIKDNGQTLKEISQETGVSYVTLVSRYSDGDRGDRLRRPITKGDITKFYGERCKQTGISLDTVMHRIKRGWSEERLFDPLVYRGRRNGNNTRGEG